MKDKEKLLFKDLVYVTNIKRAFSYSEEEATDVFNKAKSLSYSGEFELYDPRPEQVKSQDVFKVLGIDRAESRQAYLDSLKLKQLKGEQ